MGQDPQMKVFMHFPQGKERPLKREEEEKIGGPSPFPPKPPAELGHGSR